MKRSRADAAKAFQDAAPYHSELREIHKWCMPWRTPTAAQSSQGQQQGGANRTAHLFDSTFISAAAAFAGQTQADWTPPHSDFFTMEAGPLVDDADKPQWTRVLQNAAKTIHSLLPPVHRTLHESYFDLFAGTAAMLVNHGSQRFPIRGLAVSPLEMAMEDGPFGDIWRRWWKRNWRCGDVPDIWPAGNISDKLAQRIKDDPSLPVEVTQATIWNPKTERWRHTVWTSSCEAKDWLWYEEFTTSPWITPRFFKVPGESLGRGLAHLGLPGARTLNKARELALHAAAFAVMGLWLRRDDGVFNPDTATFAPGKMWTVATTGGALGSSITRLDVPKDFDITTVVMSDEREQLNKILMNDELPDHNDPVRSATEVAGRLARFARMKGGVGPRISYELVTMLVERAVDILVTHYPQALPGLPKGFVLDQILSKVTITSPAAAAQRSNDVERAVNWLQIMSMLWGPQATMMLAKSEDLGPQLGRWLGVEEKYIPSKDEIKEFKAQLAQIAAAQSAAQQKPPTPEQQTRALVNGQGAQGMPEMGSAMAGAMQ